VPLRLPRFVMTPTAPGFTVQFGFWPVLRFIVTSLQGSTWMVTHDWLFAGLVSLTLLTVAQFLIALPAGAFTVAFMVNVPEYPGGKVSPGPPQLASPVGMPRLHCQPG